MAIQIACPSCHKRYQVQREMNGKRMKCPACQTQFVLNIKTPGAAPASGQKPTPPKQDFARYGLDGPLQQNPEIFPAQTAGPSADIGSAIEDPGFAEIDPQRLVPPKDDIEPDPIYSNPALSHSAAMTAVRKGKPNASTSGYQSNAQLVRSITILFIAMYVIPLFALVAMLMTALTSGPQRPSSGMSMTGLVMLILFGIAAVLSVAAVVSFLVFIYRANRNARALGAVGMKFSPGWSVGWWFVPIVNVVLPFLAIGEILKASRPGPAGQQWQAAAFPPIVIAWWVASLVPGLSVFAPLIAILVIRAIHTAQESNVK